MFDNSHRCKETLEYDVEICFMMLFGELSGIVKLLVT
jgi:hypothetical protein